MVPEPAAPLRLMANRSDRSALNPARSAADSIRFASSFMPSVVNSKNRSTVTPVPHVDSSLTPSWAMVPPPDESVRGGAADLSHHRAQPDGQSAIDDQAGAGDEAGLGAGQEEDRRGDLLRPADAAG